MKNIALGVAVLMLGSGVALAKDLKAPKAGVEMSNAEMDKVSAGGIISAGNGLANAWDNAPGGEGTGAWHAIGINPTDKITGVARACYAQGCL